MNKEQHVKDTEQWSNLLMSTMMGVGTYFMAPFIMGEGLGATQETLGNVGWDLGQSPILQATAIVAATGLAWVVTDRVPKRSKLPKVKPYSWMVPIGRTNRGKWVYHNFDAIPHARIFGVTGSGKSAFLQMVLYVLCNQQPPDNLNVKIIDLKSGATFAEWEHLPHVQGIYRDVDGALECLEDVEIEMRDRLEAIYNAKRSFQRLPNFPRLLLVIDEGGEMSPSEAVDTKTRREKSIRTECMNLLSTLARVGREPGIRILYGTQRPDRNTLPMHVRSQLEAIFGFRVSEDYDSKIGLGHDGAEALPKVSGRMLYRTSSLDDIEVQSAYVSQHKLTNWIRKVAADNGTIFLRPDEAETVDVDVSAKENVVSVAETSRKHAEDLGDGDTSSLYSFVGNGEIGGE